MLTTESRYDYDESLKTITPAFTPRQSVFFMPMAWTRAENIQYQPKHVLFAFSESTPLSFLTALLRKITQMKNQIVAFKGQNLSIINQNHQQYFSSQDVAKALGYSRSDKITQIYNRHADEFSTDMSGTLKLRLSGNLTTTTRIFSLRGCHLLAMFSKTPVAKEFRKWVLDLIEQHNQVVSQISFPELSEFSSEDRQFIQSILAYGIKKYKQGKITGTLDAILNPRLANLSQQLIGENND